MTLDADRKTRQGKLSLKSKNSSFWLPLAYFTKEFNPSLAKLPLKFNDGLTKLGLTSLVKQTAYRHYNDVIMGVLASKVISPNSVYSTVYSGVDQRKHQSSASLAFVWGIHRGPVNSPHKWPVTRKMFPFGDVIMRLSLWRLFSSGFGYHTIDCDIKTTRYYHIRSMYKTIYHLILCKLVLCAQMRE